MKVKICGLFRDCDIDYANEAQPDYIGFVFAKSRRALTLEQAKRMKERLDKKIKAVGVFVNADIGLIQEALGQGIVDLVQLHGQEDEATIAKLHAPVIKALRIGEAIPPNADFLLFDGAEAGSGKTFDWARLPQTEKPFFLAGGIGLHNLEKAAAIGPYCLDISSGAETDGVKDKNKMIELVRRVHNGKG